MSSNLHNCNTGTTPTFVDKSREQVIHITMVSTNIIDDILEFNLIFNDLFSLVLWQIVMITSKLNKYGICDNTNTTT